MKAFSLPFHLDTRVANMLQIIFNYFQLVRLRLIISQSYLLGMIEICKNRSFSLLDRFFGV